MSNYQQEVKLTLTADGEHDTVLTGPATLQDDNAASGNNRMRIPR